MTPDLHHILKRVIAMNEATIRRAASEAGLSAELTDRKVREFNEAKNEAEKMIVLRSITGGKSFTHQTKLGTNYNAR